MLLIEPFDRLQLIEDQKPRRSAGTSGEKIFTSRCSRPQSDALKTEGNASVEEVGAFVDRIMI